MEKNHKSIYLPLVVILLLTVFYVIYNKVLPATLNDPFAYCNKVGTADKPDNPYTGPQKPEVITQNLKKRLNMQSVSIDTLKEGIFWRCMDSKVYACYVGANLPCTNKANTDKTPTQEMNSYCASNPNSDFIPAVVTGHDTIYEWRCHKNTPEVVKQVFQTDGQGFISDIWYQIENK